MLTPLLALLAAAAPAPSAPIYGVAVAGDGDSLRIGETRIRLFGIDAPEFDQTCSKGRETWACGTASAQHLAKLVTGREVRCVVVETDAFDRTLARCSVRGTDVNRSMVASGLAVAFRKYSTDYVVAEEAAKAAKRGLWAGTFQMPSQYRAGNLAQDKPRAARRPSPRYTARAARPISGCVIKGNHSRRGDWIYHLPGMPYYEQTRPEALFCSEAEARAAGYRRSRAR